MKRPWPFGYTVALIAAATAVVIAVTSKYMGPDLSRDPQNTIERAQFICEVELAKRLKFSGGENFSYPDPTRLPTEDGGYIIKGKFKDGNRRGGFICETKYVSTQNGPQWKTSDLSVLWPLHPPSGHKGVETLIGK
jgi:hypothetical protein